ncbi:hypothetical protein [Thalassospira lucentensis]|uniref:hypothetical protein n=1 Tax=Thalassospira lucentensis TaxID=168935 RepID=UPI000525464D|nr:hypothetical protein [Thalassospira lucentensis]RCK23784.1 hypothetical protein TH1_15455 [Thalassospira lucentensis MCCC 1A00383 = DSM 14000]
MSSTSVETAFMMAIDRLLARNVLKANSSDVSKISKSAVAREAGHSRTTLYKYPNVLARLKSLEATTKPSKQSKIVRLRQENARLEQESRMARDLMATMLLQMREMERQTASRIRQAVRMTQAEGSDK